MKYFETYTSNTYAGSGNQLYFRMEKDEVRTGRVFYKISVAGEYRYSLLFSNIIDSTYADGSVSHNNLVCSSWTILGARVGKSANLPQGNAITENEEGTNISVTDWKTLSFDGQTTKQVMSGEFF